MSDESRALPPAVLGTNWVELTNGVMLNLDLIEAIVPLPDGGYRFYPNARTARGGGYWDGTLVGTRDIRAASRSPLDASRPQAHAEYPQNRP